MEDLIIWIIIWIVIALVFIISQRKIRKLLREHDAQEAMSREVERKVKKEEN